MVGDKPCVTSRFAYKSMSWKVVEIGLAWGKRGTRKVAYDDGHLPPPTSLCPKQRMMQGLKIGIPSYLNQNAKPSLLILSFNLFNQHKVVRQESPPLAETMRRGQARYCS